MVQSDEQGIGERLRKLRKDKGMTLKQVGDLLGFTPTAISCYEIGSRSPSNEIIKQLAEIYGTTIENIYGVSSESSNFKKILNTTNLHWDGIPLRAEELNFIKQFVEMRIQDKEELDKLRKQDKIG